MIDIKKLRLFPFFTNNLAITQTDEKKFYNLIFYSENSTFMRAYPNLNIKRIFVRYGTILPAKIPRLIVMPKYLSQFYANKIIPIRTNRSGLMNMFIDTSLFLERLIERFKPGPYRRPMILNKILYYLQSASEFYPDRSNVLIYHVDLTKPIPQNIYDKRSYPLYVMFKMESVPFDYVILALQTASITKYTVLKNPKQQLSLARIFNIFRSLKMLNLVDDNEKEEQEVNDYADQVTATVQMQHETDNAGKILRMLPARIH